MGGGGGGEGGLKKKVSLIFTLTNLSSCFILSVSVFLESKDIVDLHNVNFYYQIF